MNRSSQPRTRAGHIVTGAVAALALGAVSVAVVTGIPSWGSATSPLVEPATQGELRLLLARAGLVPDALAAAGVSAQGTALVVSAAGEFLAENIEDLRSAIDDLKLATLERDRLTGLVRSGRGSPEDVAALAAAKAALDSTSAELDGLVGATFEAATAGLSSGQVATLTAIRGNRESGSQELPIRFLAQERSADEWGSLRDALTNRRIATQRGEEPCQHAHTLCLAAEAGSAALQVNLEANLTAVRVAWDAAVSGQ